MLTIHEMIQIEEDTFGYMIDSEKKTCHPIKRFTFRNVNDLEIQVINYGATITSIRYPDGEGNVDDVLLGYDEIESYRHPFNPYLGATIGRVAHFTTKGHFYIHTKDYQTTTNCGEDHVNGGTLGFSRVLWKCNINDGKLTMSHLSRNGEDGYPGCVLAFITFYLDNDIFNIEYRATCTKPTPVNLSTNCFFNLAGHGSGCTAIRKHEFLLNADFYLKTNKRNVPTGDIRHVGDTALDLRTMKPLPSIKDFNHIFCRQKYDEKFFEFKASYPENGRYLEVYTTQPCFVFETGSQLPIKRPETDHEHDLKGFKGCGYDFCPFKLGFPEAETKKSEEVMTRANRQLLGKGGIFYYKYGAFRISPLGFPDAVHRKQFDNIILQPGELYFQRTSFRFGSVPIEHGA